MLYIHVDIIYEKMYVYVDDVHCTSLNKMYVLFCSVLDRWGVWKLQYFKVRYPNIFNYLT